MKKTQLVAMAAVWAAVISGCETKATEDQLQSMCRHLLEISGDYRGTQEAEEVSRIEAEYAQKEKALKEEMDRDLKGMDDVLTQKLADIEAGKAITLPPAETDESENAADEKKGKDSKAEEPLTKEQMVEAAKKDIEKKKKDITDQFERLIKVLGPQQKYAIRDAKKYVVKRQKRAAETEKRCIEDVKKRDISEKKFNCRMKSDTRDAYFACE